MVIYVDMYFILNFILNLFLVEVTALLWGKKTSVMRCATAAIVTAFFDTGLYMAAAYVGKWLFLLSLLLVPVLLALALRPIGLLQWKKVSLLFVIVVMVTGGILTALLQGYYLNERAGGLLQKHTTACVVGGIAALQVIFLLLTRQLKEMVREAASTKEGLLRHDGKEYAVRVLFDTGNRLLSPYTGEAVAVISDTLAAKIALEKGQLPVYIPYHSIGGGGIMPAYRVGCLTIAGKTVAAHFLCAVSQGLQADRGIQMIMNTENR